VPWPANWNELRSGRDCPVCQEGRPEEADDLLRVYSGDFVDAYLNRDDAALGYTIAIFRGRHVSEPTELADDESVGFWRELMRVQRAVEQRYSPMKMNIMMLGNAMPHLHAHIVPRYSDDPDGGGPPQFMMSTDERTRIDDATYLSDVAALRALLSD
jgi:diadenosine tetraphosphate (Ap4A) HIT family hydrolase